MKRRAVTRGLAVVLSFALVGCASAPPYVGQGPHPQISRGHAVPPIDFLGNVFALPAKLIFWNWRLDNHDVSADTEAYLVRYIDSPETRTDETLYSLNEYSPGRAFSRLIHNKKAAWPYRLLIGFPVTLVVEVLLPGRLFAGLLGGDMYNPFTDTVYLYSDLPSVALHEAGHSHDVNGRKRKGTYAFLRIIPFVDLYQEYQATDEAITYLIDQQDRDQEFAAYKMLYPAYGSYVGAYIPFPGAALIPILLGHVAGRSRARERAEYYRLVDAGQAPAGEPPADAVPPAP